MIVKIDGEAARPLLKGRNDPFSIKIDSLLSSYEGYDFFEVYSGEGVLIGRYYGELVIRAEKNLSEEAADELSLFLGALGFSRGICSEETGMLLKDKGFEIGDPDLLYCFAPDKSFDRRLVPEFSQLRENPPYDEVFAILKDGFPDIDYTGWYVDMNHRVRHGTAKMYIYEGATATVNGETESAALLTMLSTKSEARGKGSAAKLLRSLGLHYLDMKKILMIICRKELSGFYQRAGFKEIGRTITIGNREE